ncbi:MAG: asparaginase [Eubacterium sp.]|nr:asparaginase [Eubacterium sp.]
MDVGIRKNRILVVTTGGTICSTEGADGLNDINSSGTVPVLVNLTKECLKGYEDIVYDTISPIDTLSENMTVGHWNKLLETLRTIEYSLYDGVIILHGSDTLHMTSPLMAYMMQGLGLPVVMVAANRILTDPKSNGVNNMAYAVRFIMKGVPGVYVIYRNTDGVTYLHDALELEQCGDYSEDFFSRRMLDISGIEEDENTDGDKYPGSYRSETKRALLYEQIKLTNSILYIKPYVGINYDLFTLQGVKAVLHGLYHSSTARTNTDVDERDSSSVLSLIDRCNEAGIPVYIHPCERESVRYSSSVPMLEHGAIPISGHTWNATLIGLMIKYSE